MIRREKRFRWNENSCKKTWNNDEEVSQVFFLEKGLFRESLSEQKLI